MERVMKSVLLILGLIVMVTALTACGDNNEPTLPTVQTEGGTTSPATTPAPAQTESNVVPSPSTIYIDSPLVGIWSRTGGGLSTIVEFSSDGTGREVHSPDYNEWTIYFEWSTSGGRLTIAHLKDTSSYSIWGDGNSGAVNRSWICRFNDIDMAERMDDIGRGSSNAQILSRRLSEVYDGFSLLTGSWEWHPAFNERAISTILFNPDGTGMEISNEIEFYFSWISGDSIPYTYDRQLTRIFYEPIKSSVNYALSGNDLTLIGRNETVSFIRLGGS